MIDHLNGTHETVEYQKKTHLRIYTDTTYTENFPVHWHNEIEIIHIKSENLLVRCQGLDYKLQKGDTLFICPAAIHEIYNSPAGERFYIQADMSGFFQLQELNVLFSLMSPAVLISPSLFPGIYNEITDQIEQIRQFSLRGTGKPANNLNTGGGRHGCGRLYYKESGIAVYERNLYLQPLVELPCPDWPGDAAV